MLPPWKAWEQPPLTRPQVSLPGGVAEFALFVAHGGPGGAHAAPRRDSAGGGGPVDAAALEGLVAAAVDQTAGFLACRVAELALFVARAGPGGAHTAPGGEGAGGGGPVDAAALEGLVAAAANQAADFVPRRVAEFALFVARAGPGGAHAAPRGEGAGGGGPVDAAALEFLVAAAADQAARLGAGGVAEFALFVAQAGPGGPDRPRGGDGARAGAPVHGATLEVPVAAAVAQPADDSRRRGPQGRRLGRDGVDRLAGEGIQRFDGDAGRRGGNPVHAHPRSGMGREDLAGLPGLVVAVVAVEGRGARLQRDGTSAEALDNLDSAVAAERRCRVVAHREAQLEVVDLAADGIRELDGTVGVRASPGLQLVGVLARCLPQVPDLVAGAEAAKLIDGGADHRLADLGDAHQVEVVLVFLDAARAVGECSVRVAGGVHGAVRARGACWRASAPGRARIRGSARSWSGSPGAA